VTDAPQEKQSCRGSPSVLQGLLPSKQRGDQKAAEASRLDHDRSNDLCGEKGTLEASAHPRCGIPEAQSSGDHIFASAQDQTAPSEGHPILGRRLCGRDVLEFDPFDPNNWEKIDSIRKADGYRVYLDPACETFCLVDQIDYAWSVQWKWAVNKPHPKRNGNKRYARRSAGWGGSYKVPIYLHVEIMKRTKRRKPSPLHKYCDHKDGNEWNCRRGNLRWATSKQNAKNMARVRNAKSRKRRRR
jgi:hypothetical protein